MNIVKGATSVLHPRSITKSKSYQKLKIFDFRPILPVPEAKSAMIFMIENLSELWSKLKFV